MATLEWEDRNLYCVQDGNQVYVSWNPAQSSVFGQKIEYFLYVEGFFVYSGTDTYATVYIGDQFQFNQQYTYNVEAHCGELVEYSEDVLFTATESGSTQPDSSHHYTVRWYVNGSWQDCLIYYYDGSNWIECTPYFYNGSEWETCSF